MIFYRDIGVKTQYFHSFIVFFWVTFFSCSFFSSRNWKGRKLSQWQEDSHFCVGLYPEIHPLFCNALRICLGYLRVLVYFMDLKIKLGMLIFTTVRSWSRKSLLLNKHEVQTDWNYDEFLKYHWNLKSFQSIIILWKFLYSSSRTIATLNKRDKVSKASFITSSAMVFAI